MDAIIVPDTLYLLMTLMQRVTQNPATFLSIKYDYQLKKEKH